MYDVCDFATERWMLNDKVLLEVNASWKEGIDDPSITVQTTDSSHIDGTLDYVPIMHMVI